METHIGAGAGQALEDAYILGRTLAHPNCTKDTIVEALKIYEGIRLPFANTIAQKTRLVGLLYEFNVEGHYDGSYPVHGADSDAIQTVKRAIHEQWEWKEASERVPDDDWFNAEEMLGKLSA
jgi:salicylate hydroxylase